MAYFLSLCQDLVERSEQHYTDRSLSLSLNEIRTVYFFTFSRVVYFRWFASWRGTLSTSELLKMEDSLADFFLLCSCSVRTLRLASGWQSCMQMQSSSFTFVWQSKSNWSPLFTALMRTYQIKSYCATSNIVWGTDPRHGRALRGGKNYVSNKCFIVWLQFSNPNPNKWLISKDSVKTAGSDKMAMYKTPMKNDFCL